MHLQTLFAPVAAVAEVTDGSGKVDAKLANHAPTFQKFTSLVNKIGQSYYLFAADLLILET